MIIKRIKMSTKEPLESSKIARNVNELHEKIQTLFVIKKKKRKRKGRITPKKMF